MKAIAILFTLFLLTLSHVSRANYEADSLARTIADAPEEDQLDLKNLLARAWMKSDLEQALKVSEEVEQLAKEKNQYRAWAEAVRIKGIIASKSGEYQKALDLFSDALDLAKNGGLIRAEINNHISLGNVHLKLSDHASALAAYQTGLKRSKEEKLDDRASLALSNIGLVHANQGNFDKAVNYYQEALVIQKELGDEPAMAITLGNIGIYHAAQGIWQEATSYTQQALEINKKLGNREGMAYNLNNLGNMFLDSEQPEEAEVALKQSLKLNRELKDRRMEAYNLSNLSAVSHDLGNYAQALEFGLQSETVAAELQLPALRQEAYLNLSKAYEGLGDFERAYRMHRKFEQLKDSLFSAEKSKVIAEMEAKYQNEKDSLTIARLEKSEAEKQSQIQEEENKRRQRELMLWGGGLLVLLSGIFLFFLFAGYRKRVKARQALVEEQAEARKSRTEQQLAEMKLMALRSQMNPHFVFNALSSIQHFIMKSDKLAGYNYLSKFARLIRMILDNAQKSNISLEDELKTLELYLSIETLRFNDRFDYELNVDPELSKEHCEIPAMVIQPYVENAIIHGLMNKSGKGRLKIDLRKENSLIVCIIEDNGVGREKAEALKKNKLLNHQSVGISNIEKRLEILNLVREEKLSATINDILDQEGNVAGTKVEVSIPVVS